MKGLFNAITEHSFAEDVCFLCGVELSDETRSDEHIFPKWLLSKFSLHDKKMRLLNGTLIPYRHLVVPCCKSCNNDHLSKVEASVQPAILAGEKGVASINKLVLIQWVLKIFYGLLYRNVFLPFDRAKPDLGPIIGKEDMKQLQLLHYILQSTRVPMTFESYDNDTPASIFVFRLRPSNDPAFDFHYVDDIPSRAVSIRMRSVGILVAFDMGAQAVEGREYFSKYQPYELHQIQFKELCASFFVKASKLNRNPAVVFSETPEGIRFLTLPIAGLSPQPVFDENSMDEMGQALSFFCDISLDVAMPRPGERITFLTNSDGSFRNIIDDECGR